VVSSPLHRIQVEKILPTDILRLANEDQHLTSANKTSVRDLPGDPYQKLRVFPAFVAFLLDIEDQRKMRNPTERKTELTKPMIEFSEAKHMAMFGRSLWQIYANENKLYDVAQMKITGSYMRVVISIDQRTGFLHTTCPSEPILAHAAMK
jgi:hypothetical protein